MKNWTVLKCFQPSSNWKYFLSGYFGYFGLAKKKKKKQEKKRSQVSVALLSAEVIQDNKRGKGS